MDEPTYSKQKNRTAPYAPDEIQRATERARTLTSASPNDLPDEDGPEPWQYVLRRADLLDLFDTTPDLSGNEIDVSRFIRATEDKDAYLAWRDWDGDSAPPESLNELTDEELCPVSLGGLREFMRKRELYSWNFATEEWALADKDRLYAGMLLVARAGTGGYTEREGWSPESKARVEPVTPGHNETEGDSSDFRTFETYRQSLRDHTTRVIQEIEVLLGSKNFDPVHADALRAAAAKHDWGKAHEIFQKTLHKNDDSTELLAKQVKANAGRHERKHFRHELGSALAMLVSGESDLATYLVAAHHGRIRLGIRSMPGETEKEHIRTARGIRQGDILPTCTLTDGVSVPATQLALAPMELGADGGSWTDRMLRLRDEIGPFRLAYLEMILRAADEEASDNPGTEVAVCTP